MNFPTSISFTLTNACNLRCRMCAQWSGEGYMRGREQSSAPLMQLADWKRLVDEAAHHGVSSILLRGGEPFLYPEIVDVLEYMGRKRVFVPIDTNGTMLGKFAKDLVRMGKLHLTVSVDGPEAIHDAVRGVPGTFDKIRRGLAILRECEAKAGITIGKAICFVISPYSIKGLGDMPDVARNLGIETVAIVPYYFVPESVGQRYERVLREQLGCSAFSWRGFHHESSGVDFDEFKSEYKRYQANLKGVQNYPYMSFTLDEYRLWFWDAVTPVGSDGCNNVERLIDIQPNGEANFCVDFPDYSIGNVKQTTMEAVWNGERAEQFRRYRREKPLPVCLRCGAKYMS